jgi:hypothetical protein
MFAPIDYFSLRNIAYVCCHPIKQIAALSQVIFHRLTWFAVATLIDREKRRHAAQQQ